MKNLKWHSKTFLGKTMGIIIIMSSLLPLEILKNRISNLEKELIGKDVIINFLLKKKNETNNNTSY